jgi:photosystem II stability/assembly factor-like uncharacterized protein
MKQLKPLLAASAFALLPGAWAAAVPAALQQPAVQSPKALGAAMLAVTRAGARLVAVGERGTILLSDDGGAHWQQAQVPVKTSLTAVQFVNDKAGWAVGHLGVVLKTDDGGKTWSKQLDGIAAAQLALDAAKKEGNEKAIADAEHLVADGPDKPFLDLYFENEQTGYITGAYNLMFKTTDGGKSWQPWQSHVANPKGLHLYSIRGAGNAIYIAGEQGLLLRSADGGATFAALESPYKGTYFGMVAAASGEVVVFGLRGNAFRSEDGGKSWQKVETGVQAALVAGAETADGSLVIVSQNGDVLISRDKGKTFAPQPGEPLPLAAVTPAKDNGLVVAGLRGVKRLALAQK